MNPYLQDVAGLPELSVRELIDRLARTEDATRSITTGTLTRESTRTLLAYQQAILAELRRRRPATVPHAGATRAR